MWHALHVFESLVTSWQSIFSWKSIEITHANVWGDFSAKKLESSLVLWLPNQTWVCLPKQHSNANLLTPDCGEGKLNIHTRHQREYGRQVLRRPDSHKVSSEGLLKVRSGRGHKLPDQLMGDVLVGWWWDHHGVSGDSQSSASGSSCSGVCVLVGSSSLLPPDGSFQYMLRILSIAHEEELKVLDFVS